MPIIQIGEKLLVKIVNDLMHFRERIPLLTYFQRSYTTNTHGVKTELGDGFILQYIEDQSSLVKDISGKTFYAKVNLRNGIYCFISLPKEFAEKVISIDVVDTKISLI